MAIKYNFISQAESYQKNPESETVSASSKTTDYWTHKFINSSNNKRKWEDSAIAKIYCGTSETHAQAEKALEQLHEDISHNIPLHYYETW